jgi:hypothetical protein
MREERGEGRGGKDLSQRIKLEEMVHGDDRGSEEDLREFVKLQI